MTRVLSRALPFLLAAAAILVAWTAVIQVFKPHDSLLPPPALVAREFWQLLQTGDLFTHIGASLGRVFSAWTVAGLVAVPLGLAMGRLPTVERLLDPLVELIRPISPLAWIPLAILWFGIDLSAKVFIVFVAAVVPCVLNSYQAVKNTPIELLNAGRSLGAKKGRLLWEVVMPASLPVILGGLRIALGTAWATIVAAELVVSLAGFGFLIMNGYRNLESNIVVCGMLAVAVAGFLMNLAFVRISRRLVPWADHK